VVQIKETLRRWLKGEGERPIASGVGVDRKTARRYITAAVELGIDRSAGEGQLTDELIGQVQKRWDTAIPRRTRPCGSVHAYAVSSHGDPGSCTYDRSVLVGRPLKARANPKSARLETALAADRGEKRLRTSLVKTWFAGPERGRCRRARRRNRR
jgi:hypothetical protein